MNSPDVQMSQNRCNIQICHHLQCTWETHINGLPTCVWSCVAQCIILACTSQSRGHRGMGQVFTCTCTCRAVEYHAMRMLHRWTLIIWESNQFFCSTEIIQPNKLIIAYLFYQVDWTSFSYSRSMKEKLCL